jgi:peptide/nickel transport system permease protein
VNEDPPSRESTVAIDLSRRKSSRRNDDSSPNATLAGPIPAVRGDGAEASVVRHSLVEARRVAAPYLTMARIAVVRLAGDRLARAGTLLVAMLALLGIFADLLASDLPIACRWQGVVYLMPNLVHPPALAGIDGHRMRADGLPGDWAVLPLVAYGPNSPSAGETLLAPLAKGHPFGTDATGRDVFARVVYGARTALGVGLAASLVLVAIGVALGALAGFAGGIVDALVARAVESLTAIPTIVLVLVVGAIVPHATQGTLLATIVLTRWTELARVVRAEILHALRADYVTAARALGASAPRVLWRHVLPNAIAPAIVGATFALAWVILIESTVDFLRVGTVEAHVSWGEVLGEARSHPQAWWLVAFPGAALLTALVGLNLIGEAARNALDPRLRGKES